MSEPKVVNKPMSAAAAENWGCALVLCVALLVHNLPAIIDAFNGKPTPEERIRSIVREEIKNLQGS